jgi:hypothetical protein
VPVLINISSAQDTLDAKNLLLPYEPGNVQSLIEPMTLKTYINPFGE